MDQKQLGNSNSGEFCGLSSPIWEWRRQYLFGDEVTPLITMQDVFFDHTDLDFLPFQDLFFPDDVLPSLFDGGIEVEFDNDKYCNAEGVIEENHGNNVEKKAAEVPEEPEVKMRCGDDREKAATGLTFEEVSRYFYMPIMQAARELNVGLTLLKKRCRELGIPRWPHRKMKSLQTLINSVQELGSENDSVGEAQLRCAVEMLEEERKMIEMEPGTQLEERTKRLRQAYFKASYKKRRLLVRPTSDQLPKHDVVSCYAGNDCGTLGIPIISEAARRKTNQGHLKKMLMTGLSC